MFAQCERSERARRRRAMWPRTINGIRKTTARDDVPTTALCQATDEDRTISATVLKLSARTSIKANRCAESDIRDDAFQSAARVHVFIPIARANIQLTFARGRCTDARAGKIRTVGTYRVIRLTKARKHSVSVMRRAKL